MIPSWSHAAYIFLSLPGPSHIKKVSSFPNTVKVNLQSSSHLITAHFVWSLEAAWG